MAKKLYSTDDNSIFEYSQEILKSNLFADLFRLRLRYLSPNIILSRMNTLKPRGTL